MGRITASRKQLKPDPMYGSILAAKFINTLMHDGKKSVAQNVFYDALEIVKKRVPDKEPIEVFTQALEHVKPSIEVRSKRVGGAAYQVPMQVNRTRQQSLAIRWVLMAIREKKGRPTAQKLADEFVAAFNREAAAKTSTVWLTPIRRSRISRGNHNDQHAAALTSRGVFYALTVTMATPLERIRNIGIIAHIDAGK